VVGAVAARRLLVPMLDEPAAVAPPCPAGTVECRSVAGFIPHRSCVYLVAHMAGLRVRRRLASRVHAGASRSLRVQFGRSRSP